jgi:hypothetical protein
MLHAQVHTAGIRHRRQLLSLRMYGERNRLVLSAFESAPGRPSCLPPQFLFQQHGYV